MLGFLLVPGIPGIITQSPPLFMSNCSPATVGVDVAGIFFTQTINHLSYIDIPNKTKFFSVQLGKTLALTFLRIYAFLIEYV